MIGSLLIANRGEIARRILRTARRLGVRTVAVYSDADAGAPFVREADAAVRLGPALARDSYLRGDLTLAAAKRAGITPSDPGVKPAGATTGIGRGVLRTWIVPVKSFRIGDEEIHNTHLRIADATNLGRDMLIGADFFLSHHIYVANSQRKLYFTYNGGTVFNLAPDADKEWLRWSPSIPIKAQEVSPASSPEKAILPSILKH